MSISFTQSVTAFDAGQMAVVSQAVAMAEDLVSDHYKLSATQLRQLNYDVKTRADLADHEIVADHFAQIVRYRAEKHNAVLITSAQDFYKVCIQDHSILACLKDHTEMALYPFLLYVICHELVHVVRFKRFQQQFHVPDELKCAEETRVHRITHEILCPRKIKGMGPVFAFYENWLTATEMS